MKNYKKVYSTSGPVKRGRRRIGEFTDQIRRFKAGLDSEQLIRHENKMRETYGLELA